MNTSNILDSITNFGDEMMSTDGVRAAAAWFAMNKPDADYALDDEEAPYKLRTMVGERIGWEAAQEGLDPEGDIPRYVDYMRLRDAYGPIWQLVVLEHYMNSTMEQEGQPLKSTTATVVGTWIMAIMHYLEACAAHEAQQKEEELEATT